MDIKSFIVRHELNLLHVSALVTWAAVAVVVMASIDHQRAGGGAIWLVGSSLGIYAAATAGATWGVRTGPPEWVRNACLATMLLSVGVICWFVNQTVQLILLVVFAAVSAMSLPLIKAVLIVIFSHLALTSLIAFRSHPEYLWVSSALFFTFELFSLFAGHTVARERDARFALAATNRQLTATQNLLTQAAQQEERQRMARDLHDVLGHHLTGLSLQLELAKHRTAGEARQAVEKALALTKLLLADVRQVVSEARETAAMDLGTSLAELAKSARAKVELDVPGGCRTADARVAEAIFRTAQEIITNSNRHSVNPVLHLQLRERSAQWELEAQESGAAGIPLCPGQGLKGMKERIEELGGSLNIESSPVLRHSVVIPKND